MGTLTKKYRLFWKNETKEILNNYKDDYTGSITMYPESEPYTYFESDAYQDILDKIGRLGLIERQVILPIPPPIEN